SHLPALMVVGQSAITAAGANHHSGSGRPVGGRKVTRQRRPVRRFVANFPGSTLWPKQLLLPQPAKPDGQNCPRVFAVVATVAVDELVIVLGELQGGGHLLIRQGPVAGLIIQIMRAVLQEDSNRLPRGLTNLSRIHVAAADVGETPDMAQHLAKQV